MRINLQMAEVGSVRCFSWVRTVSDSQRVTGTAGALQPRPTTLTGEEALRSQLTWCKSKSLCSSSPLQEYNACKCRHTCMCATCMYVWSVCCAYMCLYVCIHSSRLYFVVVVFLSISGKEPNCFQGWRTISLRFQRKPPGWASCKSQQLPGGGGWGREKGSTHHWSQAGMEGRGSRERVEPTVREAGWGESKRNQQWAACGAGCLLQLCEQLARASDSTHHWLRLSDPQTCFCLGNTCNNPFLSTHRVVEGPKDTCAYGRIYMCWIQTPPLLLLLLHYLFS